MASIAMNSANNQYATNINSYGITQPEWLTSELCTGTTIIAVQCQGGVIIGADSRTSTGAYVANRFTDKLTHVTDQIYCCRSGSAADTQAVTDAVKHHLGIYRMQMEKEPTVHTAANVFRNICYEYRDQLLAGIIVAGWDKDNGGQVFRVPIGGSLIQQPLAMGGSGSTYIYGYADATYKENMTKEEALQFCANCISLAINRDGGSGGVIRLAAITESGVERHVLMGDQLPKFYEG
ncbi:PSMB6 [Bugula neritina]|uniref:Proteasome subunit beta n=1 Tax=Bugula neritina TaxID=10212 RepID=A0A7J7IS89_BUGNE|nr:PSMB6 [Bugula neritina]